MGMSWDICHENPKHSMYGTYFTYLCLQKNNPNVVSCYGPIPSRIHLRWCFYLPTNSPINKEINHSWIGKKKHFTIGSVMGIAPWKITSWKMKFPFKGWPPTFGGELLVLGYQVILMFNRKYIDSFRVHFSIAMLVYRSVSRGDLAWPKDAAATGAGVISENLRKQWQGWICDLWLFVKFVENIRTNIRNYGKHIRKYGKSCE